MLASRSLLYMEVSVLPSPILPQMVPPPPLLSTPLFPSPPLQYPTVLLHTPVVPREFKTQYLMCAVSNIYSDYICK